MGKKIKITESQLKFIMKNKGNVTEQVNFNDGKDEFNSMKNSVSMYMGQNHEGFQSAEELMSSISERLSNAIGLQDWDLVKEVLNDTNKFNSSNTEIGGQSSVLDDTPEERDERNYGLENGGMNENIQKIRSNFKRFI